MSTKRLQAVKFEGGDDMDVSELVRRIKANADELYERVNVQRSRTGAFDEAIAIEMLLYSADILAWVKARGVRP